MGDFTTGLFGFDPSDQGANLARELAVVASGWDRMGGRRSFLRESAIQRAADVIWGRAGVPGPVVRAASMTEEADLRRLRTAGVQDGGEFRFDAGRPLEDVLLSLIQLAAYDSLPAGDRTFINRDGACARLAAAWLEGYDRAAGRSEHGTLQVPGSARGADVAGRGL